MASLLTGAVTMAWIRPDKASRLAASRYASLRLPASALSSPHSIPEESVPSSLANRTGSLVSAERSWLQHHFTAAGNRVVTLSKLERPVKTSQPARRRTTDLALQIAS